MKKSIIKKGLGVLSITVLTLTLFLNTNLVNNSNTVDVNLANLLHLSSANAEGGCGNVVYACNAAHPSDYWAFLACVEDEGC